MNFNLDEGVVSFNVLLCISFSLHSVMLDNNAQTGCLLHIKTITVHFPALATH